MLLFWPEYKTFSEKCFKVNKLAVLKEMLSSSKRTMIYHEKPNLGKEYYQTREGKAASLNIICSYQ